MERTALAALAELRKGLREERDGEFPNEPDFYEWAEFVVNEIEEAIKTVE